MADENHKWLTFWSAIFYWVIITHVMNSAIYTRMADENHKWLTFWSAIFYWVIITQGPLGLALFITWVMITQ
jgi:hypothetical protein